MDPLSECIYQADKNLSIDMAIAWSSYAANMALCIYTLSFPCVGVAVVGYLYAYHSAKETHALRIENCRLKY
jgi:hypothetical protein